MFDIGTIDCWQDGYKRAVGCAEAENWRRFGQGDYSRLWKMIFLKDWAGFYINELGKEWFWEEIYQRCDFDNISQN